MIRPLRLAAALLALLAALPAAAENGVKRLYILDCGENLGADQARWSPGVNVGQPIELSDNCYLIRHEKGLLLWDTGIPDSVAALPDGMPTAGGAIVQRRTKTLEAQLAEIAVKPGDIDFVAISHTHGDHVGNVDLFPEATVLMQEAEVSWAFAGGKAPFAPRDNIEKLNGDRDVFGDGSVVILSTPGHTPGHQSLLVTLPRTGAVLLTGDAVHFRDNWEHKRVPTMNTDRDQTLASMARLEKTAAEKKAQLWINHDKPQSERQRHAPQFYE
jgi:glyoxylase-like metal-dependent hydrolase (beta-lactamase superfamily II)